MTISYQTPVPISLNSQNGSLTLATKNPQTFYSLRLLFFNSQVNLTVSYYDINGKLVSQVTYDTPESISVKNGDYSLITWNDTYNYQVQGWYQEIIPQTASDIETLQTEFDLNAVPVGIVNVNNIIRSTLSSNPISGTTSATVGTLTPLFSTSTLAKHFQIYYPKSATGILSVYYTNAAGSQVAQLSPQSGWEFTCQMNEQIDLSTIYVSSTVASDTYTGAYEV